MKHNTTGVLAALRIAGLAATLWCAGANAFAAEHALYSAVGDVTRAPIGWVGFCADHPRECNVKPLPARDVVLSATAWRDLVQINHYVNKTVKPMTDLEHYGVVEKWAYPDDGYGDCEDYVLQKRRLLLQAGWPRQALLITVVRDQHGDGHAVLTVRTDRGEFILDNETEKVVLWSDSGYRFVKRQSQTDPNTWVSLGTPPAMAVTASH
jgi:predicted transglutaminase-like cysteine proteinase